MEIKFLTEPLEKIKTQAMVITVFEEEHESIEVFDTLNEKINLKLKKLFTSKEVTGRYKEFTILHSDNFEADRILIMGLGKRKDLTTEKLRAVMAVAARNIRRINLSQMTVVEGFQDWNLSSEESACAIVEGIQLGLYKFRKHQSGEQKNYKAIHELIIAVKDSSKLDEISRGTEKGRNLSDATNLARDLTNEPANFLTPDAFAKEAERVAKENDIKITVLGKDEIKEANMHALLAVNAGSHEPPRFVIMEYNGASPDSKVLGLVGKGVTFDSGGLSIKPSDSMFRMHCDMAGAAAVLGAIKSIARQKLKINVVAVMPLTENLVDSNSYKVGDVIQTKEGKTIEILNTDAEGRLILADALTYIRQYKKIDYVIDIATLTGAIVVALGHYCSGVMTNNNELCNVVREAGDIAGEKVWELPIFEEYKSQIKSDIADLENSGGRAAGSITAAMFLKEFVGDTPWVHIDIAGTAWIGESIAMYMKNPYIPKEGGTGVGTRMLYHVAEKLADK